MSEEIVYAAKDGDGKLFLWRGSIPTWNPSTKDFHQFDSGNLIGFVDKEDESVLGYSRIKPGGIRRVEQPVLLPVKRELYS